MTKSRIAQIIAFVFVPLWCFLIFCDDHNIVEPRFFSDADVGELAVCDTSSIGGGGNVIPHEFSVQVCWANVQKELISVYLTLPQSTEVLINLIHPNGSVSSITSASGHRLSAGNHHMQIEFYGAKQGGVYGVSVRAGEHRENFWFKVD